MAIKAELKEAMRLNKKDRLWFIDYWANYIKTHTDQEWSAQQNVLIDSIIPYEKPIKRA